MSDRSAEATSARPRLRQAGLVALGFAILMVLGSCGPRPNAEPDLVQTVGVIILVQTEGAANPEGQAVFVELNEARAKELMENSLGPALGTCTVGSHSAAVAGAVATVPGGARLSVANTVFNVDGIEYAEMRPTDTGAYRLTGAAEPLPATGLTLSVPASAYYEGVGSLAVSTGTPPTLEPGFDATAIGLDTQFRWQASSGAGTLLLIGTGSGVTFSCYADDTAGEFTFPEATRSELTAAGFTTGKLRVLGRLATTTATVGSSDLLLVGALRLTDLGEER